MMFKLNAQLLHKARAILHDRPQIYWVIGGACTGKSTVCQAVAAKSGITLYDMDAHIFEYYMPLYRPERHPASTAWFHAENPFAEVMALPWPEFNSLNRASMAEMLDLLADELADQEEQPLLIDGGVTHPSVLTQVIPAAQIICLTTADARRVQIWKTAPERAEFRSWIDALPDPEGMWQKFLSHDHKMNAIIVDESRAGGIPLLPRDDDSSVEELAALVAQHFGLNLS